MREKLKDKHIQAALWIAVLIILWEASARTGLVNAYIMPPFTTVISKLATEIFTGNLGKQTLSSLWMILEGYILSFIIAIVITVLCVCSKMVNSLFNTLSTILSPLPAVAVMPLIIMWFGIGSTAMFVIIIHGVLWTLVQHLIDALKAIPSTQIEFGKNIGLTPVKMFSGIVAFAIMPELIAGLRTGWGRAWRALISAEMVFGMIGTYGGIGYYIFMSRSYARTADVLAGIIVIAAIGVLAESVVFGNIERYTVQKWGMTRE